MQSKIFAIEMNSNGKANVTLGKEKSPTHLEHMMRIFFSWAGCQNVNAN